MFCFLKRDWLHSIECEASAKLKPDGDKLPLTVKKITLDQLS